MSFTIRALPDWPIRSVALALALSGGAAIGQATEVVGWVEPDPKTKTVPLAAFRLDRAGKAIPYPTTGLHACDRLTLVDEAVVVRVRLASNLRMQLDANTRELEIPCDQRGIAASLAAALQALLGSADQRKVRVAAVTRDMTPLSLPALVAPQAHLIAGQRPLYLAWTGGARPFSVQLVNAADGREVVTQSRIDAQSVLLPTVALEPGRYTLWVRNRAGHRIEGLRDDALFVVAAADAPRMPEVLQAAGLAEETRTLFYADYLAGLDDGRWTLEAMQQVAALKSRSPASV
jgi:hypothetical protein